MARHRSPRGRRASTGSPAPFRAEPLVRRAAAARPLMQSVPVRRSAAAVAVTGGALSLMGAAAPQQDVPQQGSTAVTGVATAATLVPAPLPASVVMLAAVSPIAPAPEVLDDPTALVKAVQLGEELAARQEAERLAAEEQARVDAERVAEEAAEREAAAAAEAERRESVRADCGIDTGQLGAVKGFVREAAQFLGCAFGVDAMHGVAGRAGTSDHPSGLAVDFMIDRAGGDALAACALDNMSALGIKYVIWEQRINHGNGWEMMEDRGGVTANHFDHVHVSFSRAGDGELSGC